MEAAEAVVMDGGEHLVRVHPDHADRRRPAGRGAARQQDQTGHPLLGPANPPDHPAVRGEHQVERAFARLDLDVGGASLAIDVAGSDRGQGLAFIDAEQHHPVIGAGRGHGAGRLGRGGIVPILLVAAAGLLHGRVDGEVIDGRGGRGRPARAFGERRLRHGAEPGTADHRAAHQDQIPPVLHPPTLLPSHYRLTRSTLPLHASVKWRCSARWSCAPGHSGISGRAVSQGRQPWSPSP